MAIDRRRTRGGACDLFFHCWKLKHGLHHPSASFTVPLSLSSEQCYLLWKGLSSICPSVEFSFHSLLICLQRELAQPRSNQPRLQSLWFSRPRSSAHTHTPILPREVGKCGIHWEMALQRDINFYLMALHSLSYLQFVQRVKKSCFMW